MMVSLDGFYEGPNEDISWHNVDEEFNEFAIQQTGEVGTLLFGRKTYELMASYWPTEAAKRDDPVIAGLMNRLPKIVFSKTLDEDHVGWENSRLVKEGIGDEVSGLKKQPGMDIAIFGRSDLTVSLAQMGLVDEFRIMVNPVVLGEGTPLLKGIDHKLNLKLLKTRPFQSGNVLLYYQLEKE
jgi:dihydrofolate reductase